MVGDETTPDWDDPFIEVWETLNGLNVGSSLTGTNRLTGVKEMDSLTGFNCESLTTKDEDYPFTLDEEVSSFTATKFRLVVVWFVVVLGLWAIIVVTYLTGTNWLMSIWILLLSTWITLLELPLLPYEELLNTFELDEKEVDDEEEDEAAIDEEEDEEADVDDVVDGVNWLVGIPVTNEGDEGIPPVDVMGIPADAWLILMDCGLITVDANGNELTLASAMRVICLVKT